jgi:hypothetical protein
MQEVDAAVEVEPPRSVGWIGGEYTAVLLLVADASFAKWWSKPKLDGVEVRAGEIESTFLSTPLLPSVVPMSPFPFSCELCSAKTLSTRGDVMSMARVVAVESSTAKSDRGTPECVVEVVVYSAVSPVGGRKRDAISDSERASKEAVEVEDVGEPIEGRDCSYRGGKSSRGGSRGTFSFWEEEVEGGDTKTASAVSFECLALPFGRPLLKRLERGFMARTSQKKMQKGIKVKKRTGWKHGQS